MRCGKLTVSMAEQALWSVPLPELEKVADLARSEKMTAAWELRMFNGIYANDEQTLQRLAETVTERYRVLCREQAGALRRGYEFATEESKEKLWQTAQLPLENDLKLPAKYKDNKIVEALGQMLRPPFRSWQTRKRPVMKPDCRQNSMRQRSWCRDAWIWDSWFVFAAICASRKNIRFATMRLWRAADLVRRTAMARNVCALSQSA